MNKKTLIEAAVAALLFAVEVIVVLICLFGSNMQLSGILVYILAIFTNIEVVYGIVILLINSKNDNK